MDTITHPQPRTTSAKLNFCGNTGYKPEAQVLTGGKIVTPSRVNMRELTIEQHEVALLDGSTAPIPLDLNHNGFIHLHHPSKVTDFKDINQIRDIYHHELRALIKSLTNADIVEFPPEAGAYRASEAKEGESGAALMSHLDFTEAGANHAVDQEFPDRDKDVARWAFIKVWRALSPMAPVDLPFALLDSQTLQIEDIVPVDTQYRHITGVTESAALHFNPAQRWIYFSDMTRDDIIVFKNYDSDASNNRMAGHTAFVDPTVPKDVTRRSSFELRAYVAWRK